MLAAVRTPSLPVLARRTLVASPFHNFPPAQRARRAEDPAEHQKENQPKQQKQKATIPKSLQPPKRAPSAYNLFCASYLKSRSDTSAAREPKEFFKQTSQIWQGYSLAEKQPFYDESEARQALAKQEREEFLRNTPTSELKQLNAIRKAQGKRKYCRTKPASPKPLPPFVLFIQDFRDSSDIQAILNETSPDKRPAARIAIAAGDRWRSMSPEEKAPYFEKFMKAKEELKAKDADS